MPGVVEASRSSLTSSASGSERVCTSRICWRPSLSGGGTTTRRSKRPGRSSAASSTSGRFVAPSTMTAWSDSKPSISVRIWLSVCSRSSLPPRLKPPTRERPTASSSSMKMIAGEASLACLNRSRARAAPTPTIASTNSDAAPEKNGTPASPATARASSVLPVPGAPGQQHAARDAPAEPAVAVGVLEEVDDLGQLRLGLVDPGHVVERHLSARRPRRAARGCVRSCPARPSAPPRPRAGRARRTARRAGSPGRSRGSGSAACRGRR